MNNYLNTLNPRQREAVETVKGPVLIMAGAGSGKTKALTCRIAYMLEQGIYPNEILAITFTNKAAQEMRERVHNLVGPAADRIWMYTFHSFGARFLRREIASYPPYTDRFTIYDSDDSKTLVKNCLKELNLDDKQYQPNAMQNRISSAKNQLIDPKKYRELAGSNFFNQKAADVYELYDKPGMTDFVEPLYDYETELEYQKAYIENMYGFYEYGMWLVFSRETGKLIGRAGLEHDELGYMIAPELWNQGYATEVCRFIIDYARENTDFEELYCRIDEKNVASVRLAKRLGFVRNGQIGNERNTGGLDRYVLSI